MDGFEHLLQACDVGDMLDEIASADPPAYLRRCFAEGCSAHDLAWPRVQELAVCAMALDSILSDRQYPGIEPELIADWRVHFARSCEQLRPLARDALQRAGGMPTLPADAAAELAELTRRLSSA